MDFFFYYYILYPKEKFESSSIPKEKKEAVKTSHNEAPRGSKPAGGVQYLLQCPSSWGKYKKTRTSNE